MERWRLKRRACAGRGSRKHIDDNDGRHGAQGELCSQLAKPSHQQASRDLHSGYTRRDATLEK